MTVAVVAAHPAFRVACAELPHSSRLVEDPRGAVVVTAGSADDMRRAVEQGAVAIVVVRPESALPEFEPPVVVDRALLRADLAADARSEDAPVLVQVEASSASDDAEATLRDAIGWARVLAGAPLTLRARQGGQGDLSALFDAHHQDGPVVPVALVVTVRPGTAPWLRATAVGPERREVVVDIARGLARLERTTADGRLLAPTRWEAPARLALRRAVEATRGTAPDDLAEWNHDDARAGELVSPRAGATR